jgi:tetratricopeptide (TPR) repeat protein
LIFHIVMQLVNKLEDRGQGTGDRRNKPFRHMFLVSVLFAVSYMLVAGQVWAVDGIALYQKGQFGEARVAFEAVIEENPDDPVALYYLGRLTSEGAKSQAYFQRLLNKHPKHDLADDAFLELAEVKFAQGLYLTARRQYRQLIQNYPKTDRLGMAQYRIGLTFLAIKQADSALVAFDAALDYSDIQAQSYARLGRLEALLQKGQTKKVVQEANAWLVNGAGSLDSDVREIVRAISPESLPAVRSERVQAPKRVPAVVAKEEATEFWIQIGIYTQDRYLNHWTRELKKDAFQTTIEKNKGRKVLYVGPYTTRAAALKDKKQIDKLVGTKTDIKER